jgi:hypothetical protein
MVSSTLQEEQMLYQARQKYPQQQQYQQQQQQQQQWMRRNQIAPSEAGASGTSGPKAVAPSPTAVGNDSR